MLVKQRGRQTLISCFEGEGAKGRTQNARTLPMTFFPSASFRIEGGARLGTRKPANLSPHGTC